MTTTTDTVVIGGGILGTATAFHLAQRGVKTTLLEREYLGAGATGKSHSLVRMHYTNPHDAALAHHSLPYFRCWDELVGAGDPGFVQTGVFRFAPAAQEETLRATVEMLRRVGINTCVVGPREIAALDPGVNVDGIACAAWEPDSGYADPLATTTGFARAAERAGAAIRQGVAVHAILTEGDRVSGVETSDGFIAAETVVVANGAWAPALLAPLGFDVPLVAKRVQVVVFRRPDAERVAQTTIIDGVRTVVIRPEGEMDTLVAVGLDPEPSDPDAFGESIADDFVADARRRLVACRPAMAAAPMRGGWSGVVAESPDGHIILDQSPDHRGLFMAVGCSGTNFKTGPAIGKCLAEWVTEGQPQTVNLRPFRSTRFAEGQPLVGDHEYRSDVDADVWR